MSTKDDPKKEHPEGNELPKAPEASEEVEIWTEVLPKDLAEKLTSDLSNLELVQIRETLEVFQGALPAHMVAREFERLVPGSAGRILQDVLEGTKHDRLLEAEITRREYDAQLHARVTMAITQVTGLMISLGIAWKAIDAGNSWGLALSALAILASLGGPVVVKKIVDKLSERIPDIKHPSGKSE
ncbi:MAG: hypothetical protein INF48_01840 [Rhodobacter sp.]|nr:hypothetical protein [Rhodobacter sp.]